jgi:hypothetical protein
LECLRELAVVGVPNHNSHLYFKDKLPMTSDQESSIYHESEDENGDDDDADNIDFLSFGNMTSRPVSNSKIPLPS